jgi:hypothetical protein
VFLKSAENRKEGDLALYMQKQAIEIEFDREKYFLLFSALGHPKNIY